MMRLQTLSTLLIIVKHGSSFTLQDPPAVDPSTTSDTSSSTRHRMMEDVTFTAPPRNDQGNDKQQQQDAYNFNTDVDVLDVPATPTASAPYATRAPSPSEPSPFQGESTTTTSPPTIHNTPAATTGRYPTPAPSPLKNEANNPSYSPTMTLSPTSTLRPSANTLANQAPTISAQPSAVTNDEYRKPLLPSKQPSISPSPLSKHDEQHQVTTPSSQPTTTAFPTMIPTRANVEQSSEQSPTTMYNPYENTGYHAPKLAEPASTSSNDALSSGKSKFGVAMGVLLVTGLVVVLVVKVQSGRSFGQLLTGRHELDLHAEYGRKRTSPKGFRDASDPLSMDIRGPDREFI
ncbi:hypothetical protein MPSEU_000181900 [Mayamaea pseudoterrestris]|nr:hypothetical protein MPSEU_000181900 [Mayamaea pseudoterrestris]